MKRKIMLGISLVAFSLSGLAATSVFPSAFQPPVKAKQVCSVASDIVPAFCQTSGDGSFQAVVQSCSPLGPIPMTEIYTLMMEEYGDLQTACAANAVQYSEDPKVCVAQWTCYFHGGRSTDMNGLCDGNGVACASPPRLA